MWGYLFKTASSSFSLWFHHVCSTSTLNRINGSLSRTWHGVKVRGNWRQHRGSKIADWPEMLGKCKATRLTGLDKVNYSGMIYISLKCQCFFSAVPLLKSKFIGYKLWHFVNLKHLHVAFGLMGANKIRWSANGSRLERGHWFCKL